MSTSGWQNWLHTRHAWRTTALVAGLFVLHAALFARAGLVTDSGRDLANAWLIAQGGPFPDYGPELFGRWRLGPVWFWLLALPLRLTGSLVVTAWFIGALAAAKIPLAWLVGRRLLDARLGLLAALMIALPGWSTVGSLVLAHTSVVEAAVLATLWLALCSLQNPRDAHLAAAALMLGLAVHAHPTALVVAPFVAAAAWRRLRHGRWALVLLGLLAFLLPFAPALLAEAGAGWPQAGTSLAWLLEADVVSRLARLPGLLLALTAGGSWLVGHFLLPGWLAPGWWLLVAAIGLLALTGLAGTLLRGGQVSAGVAPGGPRRAAWALLLAGAFAVLFIALLRDTTPVWMVYALAPFGCLLLALGWHGPSLRSRWPLVPILSVCVIAILLGQFAERQRWAQAGRILLPGDAIGDIAIARASPATFSPWLTVLGQADLAGQLCANDGPLSLHGELAVLLDFAQGVGFAARCGADQAPSLGGRAPGRHLFGIGAALGRELGLVPQSVQHGLDLRAPVEILGPMAGRTASVDARYRLDRQRELAQSGEKNLSGRVECKPAHWLVITNLMPMVNPLRVEVRSRDGPVPVRTRSMASRFYPCAEAGWLEWQVHTPDPQAADIVLITASGP